LVSAGEGAGSGAGEREGWRTKEGGKDCRGVEARDDAPCDSEAARQSSRGMNWKSIVGRGGGRGTGAGKRGRARRTQARSKGGRGKMLVLPRPNLHQNSNFPLPHLRSSCARRAPAKMNASSSSTVASAKSSGASAGAPSGGSVQRRLQVRWSHSVLSHSCAPFHTATQVSVAAADAGRARILPMPTPLSLFVRPFAARADAADGERRWSFRSWGENADRAAARGARSCATPAASGPVRAGERVARRPHSAARAREGAPGPCARGGTGGAKAGTWARSLGPSGPAALHIAPLIARGPSTLSSPEIPPGARCRCEEGATGASERRR
jgi:hypothetical protein